MLTKEQLELTLKNHPLVQPRLDTLRLAEEINPAFRTPHVSGGFLRNIALDKKPNDCDVIFQGNVLNQPGVLEAVREAEERLGIEPYPDWEFENVTATGFKGDFYEDSVGKSSHHTDYLTLLLMTTKGELFIGEQDKTLADFEGRVYDFRFSGIDMWAKHRGNGRSYASCVVGDMTRGLYMCYSLDLTPSNIVRLLFHHYDDLFKTLDPADQQARLSYWQKKTKGDSTYQSILDSFGIKALVCVQEG